VGASLLAEGVRVLGGCCGTGPAHTAALAEAIAGRDRRATVVDRPEAPPVAPEAVGAPPTVLERALDAGPIPIAVEMEPPRSFDAATIVAAAATLRDAGATVIDVADAPLARMRMSAWAACRLIEEHAGIETVLHCPTRGRNLLRLQGDLLGARALGIRNLFIVVGDPVSIGDYPQALNDVDVTATGLLRLVTTSLNAGTDRAGSSIGAPASFVPGAAVSPEAPDLDREVRLLQRKVTAGARFLLSQPLFSDEPLRRLLDAYGTLAGEPLPVPVLAGLLPLASGRHATFLHNEVPGIEIPAVIRDAMDRAGGGEAAWRTGRSIAVDTAASLAAAGARGIYLVPSHGRFDRAAEVLESIRA
jgi:homocysteine S-methyltransferase